MFNRYKEKALKVQALFLDRPRPPLEEALWWVDWVLRTNDSSALKPLSASEQFWFQRRLLDIWALTFITILGLLSVSVYIFLKVLSSIRSIITTRQRNIKQKEN
jgi:hypothetical protein